MKKTVAILAILLLQCISVFSQIQQGQFAERGIPVTTGAGYEVSSFHVNPCE